MTPPFLALMRHAAAAPGAGISTDFERPLTELGRRQATQAGDWLRRQGLCPRQLLSSPAKRALDSALLAAAALSLPKEQVQPIPSLYNAKPKTMLEEIHTARQERLLIVGHNPTIHLLLEQLCKEIPPPEKNRRQVPPATIAVLTHHPTEGYTLHALFRPEPTS